MQHHMAKPAFITFTGIDSEKIIPGMRYLSALYPIEWGVLIDPARTGLPLFPSHAIVEQLRHSGLRLSAHVCGVPAADIAAGGFPSLDLRGFSRIQINHGFQGSTPEQIAHCKLYAASCGVRPALQCQQGFPDADGVDWLYDVSFGTGVRPSRWIALNRKNPFCGYSGGLNAATVGSLLESLDVPSGARFWIDMESGIRTEGVFDLQKCGAVCETVYGPAHGERLWA
ncbi:hypothetical protein DFQ15_11146 [Xylophilus ampelinus]|uniref:Phosphoribosylanthranilate isomerase n=2 Tax=Xylophilus ampelinus TaxID=54067 RepID=A0A318SGJ7_9BURK|nr:hypothetical protein DFQ15_11146 [Xylophilus ampelinus]